MFKKPKYILSNNFNRHELANIFKKGLPYNEINQDINVKVIIYSIANSSI